MWSCPECGADVEEKQKARAVKEGRWRALKPEVKGHRGYRLSALISSLPNATWAKLAAEFESVKHDPDRLRVFWNTVLARPWDDNVANIDTNALMEKAEDFSLDNIPAEILALTLGGDCQDDRIEAVVAGWGRDGVCHIMHHAVFYASGRGIVEDGEVWKQFDAFLRRRYDHPLGGQLQIDSCCLDASDGDHMQTVMSFCKARSGRRVMAIKGASGFSRPRHWSRRRIKRSTAGYGLLVPIASNRKSTISLPRARCFASQTHCRKRFLSSCAPKTSSSALSAVSRLSNSSALRAWMQNAWTLLFMRLPARLRCTFQELDSTSAPTI